MGETRTFHYNSNSDSSVLKSMNGLELELTGPRTHSARFVVWKNGDDEWRVVLDEAIAPCGFLHRTKLHGCVFDDARPDGEMLERWSFWQEEENEELKEKLQKFIETEEGFKFLLAMD